MYSIYAYRLVELYSAHRFCGIAGPRALSIVGDALARTKPWYWSELFAYAFMIMAGAQEET